MRIYTQDEILRLIKFYNNSDTTEKELLKKYVEQALFKYFNHKLKSKKMRRRNSYRRSFRKRGYGKRKVSRTYYVSRGGIRL